MKLIIRNESDLLDIVCLNYIRKVMEMGRISANGKQYCYASTFTHNSKKYVIYSNLNKKSDQFIIRNDK